MIYFLTTHGTLLIHGDGGLAHAELSRIPDIDSLFGIDVPVETLRRDYRAFVENAVPTSIAFEAAHFGAGTIEIDAGRNLVSLRRGDVTLSVGPAGGAVNWAATPPDAWEHLLPLSRTDLAQLVQLVSGNWIIRSTRTLVRGWNIGLGRNFTLKVGQLEVPLPSNLPFDARAWPFRFPILLDGWRIEELCLLRPMVFYTSYRSPAVHAQLFLSIRSLLEFGRYDGHVHVLTDLGHDDLCREVGNLSRDRSSVQALAPSDWAGFVASKYCILEHQPAWQHQPVAYFDPDIVVNADITPMLIEMAVSDHMTAPIEDVGPMRTWPSVGASLIQRDGHDPRFARGFNAGTLGIPQLAGHAHSLRLIRRIITNILTSDGREHLEWVDQEVANYASFRSVHVDTAVLNRFVRYGSPYDAEHPGILSGLVHFWATPKHDRHRLMARYIKILREHGRRGHPLS